MRAFLAGVLAAVTWAFLVHHPLAGMVVVGLIASGFVSVGIGRVIGGTGDRGKW